MGLTLQLNASTEVVLMENNLELAIVRRRRRESRVYVEIIPIADSIRTFLVDEGTFQIHWQGRVTIIKGKCRIEKNGVEIMMVTRVPRRKGKVAFSGAPYIEIFRRPRTT